MNVLVSVKRVPATGAKITLTPDEQMIDASYLSFTVSPHEECAVEEAVQIVKEHGGKSTVLTLGEPDAEAQLRYAMAMGVDAAVQVVTEEGEDWGPIPTAEALTQAIQATEASNGEKFDLLLFGNESADSGGYQVGIRVAHALGLPCVTGVKAIEFDGDKVIAKREAGGGGWEIYEVPMPAMITVKEGLNLPRYPSVPGRLRAKRKSVEKLSYERGEDGLKKIRLLTPSEEGNQVEILGHGTDAAARVVDLLEELELV